jgi:hypothetical protein
MGQERPCFTFSLVMLAVNLMTLRKFISLTQVVMERFVLLDCLHLHVSMAESPTSKLLMCYCSVTQHLPGFRKHGSGSQSFAAARF